MTLPHSPWLLAATAGAVTATAIAVAYQPFLALTAAVASMVISLLLSERSRLPRLFLITLGALLTGYAFLGRGFAYLRAPPVFVGEVVLGFGLFALAVGGGLGSALRSPVGWLLVLFALDGALRTGPYLREYGLTALRDAAIWGYGAFALMVAGSVFRSRCFWSVIQHYSRWVGWFVLWAPLAFVFQMLARDWLPVVWQGSFAVTLPSLRAGEVAVHLGGAGCFLALGLHRFATPRMTVPTALKEWVWWSACLSGAFLAATKARGALLAILAAFVLVLLFGPLHTWGKPVAASVVLAGVLFALNVVVRTPTPREISLDQFVVNLRSVMSVRAEQFSEESRAWRLEWWGKIIDYTLWGEYFWKGKGFGVNLADEDGFQVTADHSLRSPHNSHLTILARMGVPGFAMWVLLQGAFALSLVRAYFRARRARQDWWAHVNLWILAYWTAFIVNGMFDVFLEGPQGGIWFWCLFGFGIAALETQKRERRAWAIEQRGASLSYLESLSRSQPLPAARR